MALQRLQKILAQAGVASRRSAERLIIDGRVRVNGRIIKELGARANPHKDRVEVDGKRLVAEKLVYYLMHKPRGVVTTLDDPEGRKSIKDLVGNIAERVFPVGRLDFQTSGALLLTNDGALAQALLHPTRSVPKIYHAKIEGPLETNRLELLRSGVTLDDGEQTAPADVQIARRDDKHTFIEVTITEGKNRQVHRMLEAVGRTVLRLTRTGFAGLAITGLRPGQIRPLSNPELSDLKQKYLNPGKKAYPGAREERPSKAFDAREERSPRVERAASGRRVERGANGKRVEFGTSGRRVERATGDQRVERVERGRRVERAGDKRVERVERGRRVERVAGDKRVEHGRRVERVANDKRSTRDRRDTTTTGPARRKRTRRP
jgi:23S rRNA pseudouridine2605 synthase